MFPSECAPTRRTFLTTAAALSTAVAGATFMPEFAFSTESELSDVNVVGPQEGLLAADRHPGVDDDLDAERHPHAAEGNDSKGPRLPAR